MATSIDRLTPRRYSENDKLVYDAMATAAFKRNRVGTGAFGLRPLDRQSDPLGVLDLDQAIIPAQSPDFTRFQHLEKVLDRLVRPSDREALTIALYEHLSDREDQGNMVYALPHLSIADVPLFVYSLMDAKLRRATRNGSRQPYVPQDIHTIAGREIGLLTMEGLALDGSNGYLVDDALAFLTNVHQTIPRGYQDGIPPEIIKRANSAFMHNYQAALQQGGQTFVVALNGEEPALQGGKLWFKRLDRSMRGLLFMPNRSHFECEEGLETIPVAIDVQPFHKDGSLKQEPVAMTFKIGTPHKVMDTLGAHPVMEELAAMLGDIKLSTTPEIVYPEPAVKLGRVAALKAQQGH